MNNFKGYFRTGLATVALVSVIAAFDMPAAGAAAGSYRWRNDDGSEAAATFAAAENTPLSRLTQTTPMRLRFGAPNPGTESELLRQAALTLESGEDSVVSAVIDAANGYAYFGTNTFPGQVVKVALGAGAAPPTRVGALTLGVG